MKFKSGRTLLLVEDEAIIAFTEKQQLESYGYSVTIAPSGEIAVKMLRESTSYELILMDVDLGSGIDGTEAAALILNEHNIPILFLSSHIEPEIVEKTEKITSYGYVVKNSGITVLDASIKMAFKLFFANQQKELQKLSLHTTLSSIGDAVISTDVAGNIKSLNHIAESLIGWTSDQVVGRPLENVYNVVCPITQEPVTSPVAAVLASSECNEKKTRAILVSKRGGVHEILHSASLIRGRDDQVIGVVVVFRDVTEESVMLDALANSEEKFRLITSNTLDTIWTIDLEMSLTYINDAVVKLLGYSVHEMFEGRPEFYATTDDLLLMKQMCDTLLEKFTKNEFIQNSIEIKLIRKDGTIIDVEVTANLLLNKYGSVIGYQGRFVDISSQKEAEIRLVRQESMQHAMLSNIYDVLAIIDVNGIIRYKSPNISRLFGWDPIELIGEYGLKTVHPDDLERVKQTFFEVIKHVGMHLSVEYRYLCKDGHYVPIILTAINLLNNPSIDGILLNYHDISKRKEAEQKLKDSETRFKALHNASFGGIAIHENGVILDCNQGLSEISGFSGEELIGKNGVLLIDEETRGIVVNNIKTGYEKPYEAVGLRKNGEKYPLRLEARNIPYLDKTVRVVEFRDLTKEKESENALRRSEAHLRTLINTLPDLIWLKDKNGFYLSCNRRFENLYGNSEQDIIGKSDYDFVDKELADFFRANDLAALKAGKPTSNEELLIFANDGHEELIDTTKTPMFDFSGELIGVLGIGHDITSRKKAEKKLEDTLQFNKDLIWELQHRVKNSFFLISSLIEVMKNSSSSDTAVKALSEIDIKVRAVAEMYNLLYTVESTTEVLVDVYLTRVVATIPLTSEIVIINENYDSFNISVQNAINLGLLVSELVINAVKYAFPDNRAGIIDISLNRVGNNVRLCVNDNGIGFPRSFDSSMSDSLGMKIIHALTMQLHGNFKIDGNKGTEALLLFSIDE